MAASVIGVDLGDLHLDFVRLTATWRGKTVWLCHRELVVLYHIARSRKPLPTPRLTELVFGHDGYDERRRLYAAICYLRLRLPDAIVTRRNPVSSKPGSYALAGQGEEMVA